jgi:hypothetical protein
MTCPTPPSALAAEPPWLGPEYAEALADHLGIATEPPALDRDTLQRILHADPAIPHHPTDRCYPIADRILARLAATEGSEP